MLFVQLGDIPSISSYSIYFLDLFPRYILSIYSLNLFPQQRISTAGHLVRISARMFNPLLNKNLPNSRIYEKESSDSWESIQILKTMQSIVHPSIHRHRPRSHKHRWMQRCSVWWKLWRSGRRPRTCSREWYSTHPSTNPRLSVSFSLSLNPTLNLHQVAGSKAPNSAYRNRHFGIRTGVVQRSSKTLSPGWHQDLSSTSRKSERAHSDPTNSHGLRGVPGAAGSRSRSTVLLNLNSGQVIIFGLLRHRN